tara:strand:- start:3194 stop:3892 length:699 start_codon:yes stop_codon:yes gene_type:complete
MGKNEFTKKQLRKQLSTLTESKGNIKSELKGAYKALKKLKQTLVGHKTGEDTLTFTDLKKIKNAARNIEDIYEDMVDTEMDEKDEEVVKKVEKKNEQSEGHGKMYNALSGIKEGKVIKMNESTLRKVVDRVVKEQEENLELGDVDAPMDEDLRKIYSDIIKALGKSRSNNPIYTDEELKKIARYLTYRIKRERDGKPNTDYSTLRKVLSGKEEILLPSLELITAITDSLNLK